MFKARKFDEAPREFDVNPAKGRHDVTVTKIEVGRSKKGDPMMTWTETIDNGPDANKTMRNFFVFGDDDSRTWAKLANICDAAGIKWEEASTLEAFAAQFPLNKIRYSVDVDYTYKIVAYLDDPNPKMFTKMSPVQTGQCPHKRDLYVTETEYNEWDGEKPTPFAGARDGWDYGEIYQKPQRPAELRFDDDYAGDGADVPAGYEAAAFADDADLPF